jgi:pimeloyl-ACP methyl ester carboxylesterase
MVARALLFLSLAGLLSCGRTTQTPAESSAPYGANPAAGNTFTHDGIKLYYEVYGSGEPLLLVHGNGSHISNFKAQIDFFRTHYRVIAMDSRDHGRSGDSTDKLTYEKMTSDLVALLDHLQTGPVYVLGWSDGGIEALELGMHYPDKVKKIASMGANLEPEGARPEAIAMVKSLLSGMPAAERETPQGKRELKVVAMMLEEPHIPLAALETITAPTLIMAADHDVIRDEHTVEIYHHIPNSELAIFPNATHIIPYDDPDLFNATVDRFFRTPFVKKDRIQDMLKSLAAQEASQK